MLRIDEIPESVQTWFDRTRPGWREPFEHPPLFERKVTETTFKGIMLDCGHDKIVSSRARIIEGAYVICDTCRNAYDPQIERRIHVSCL